jgi:hypothetical protein
LSEYPFKSKIEEALLANGVNNILLAPLIDGEETIGMLELATPTPGTLNPISAHKVENVLPLFTAAVKRVKEEMATEGTGDHSGRMHGDTSKCAVALLSSRDESIEQTKSRCKGIYGRNSLQGCISNVWHV